MFRAKPSSTEAPRGVGSGDPELDALRSTEVGAGAASAPGAWPDEAHSPAFSGSGGSHALSTDAAGPADALSDGPTARKPIAADPDADLLAAYAAGEAGAAAKLVARLAPQLLAIAQRMLGDRAEAEDVTQEAILRLWRTAPNWRTGEAKVSSWVTRVAINLATDRLRRRRRGVAWDDAFAPGQEPPDGQSSAETEMRQAERAAALRAALADLPERQGQAVALRHLQGLSNPEIAEIMGIGVEAVESLTARGKRTLATRLASRRQELALEDGDE